MTDQPDNPAALRRRAKQVLKDNDRGRYTVPNPTIYPFQWNWDSCFTALGLHAIDPARGWRELVTLTEHQWVDGMIPHIVFHRDDDRYFPGPAIWATGHQSPKASLGVLTSGITQPPVLGLVLETLSNRSDLDDPTLRPIARRLVAAADRWHRWFVDHRDPDRQGLVAIIHPWEAGRDNAADWDDALQVVGTDQLLPYRRCDTEHAEAVERPTDADYDRFISLLQTFRSRDWRQSELHDASPFRMVDPGFNACLIASDLALGRVAARLGDADVAARATRRARSKTAALDRLWHPGLGQFVCWDRIVDRRSDNASVAGLLPLLALSAADPRSAMLATRIERWMDVAPFGLASQDPTSKVFDPVRYWRGPSWLVVNWLIVKSLLDQGRHDLAERLIESSLALVATSGFREYFDPTTGDGLGGDGFSWTAAMTLEFLGLTRQC
ncbi:MAG: trehalase family glycosidase [Actinomycetota bacterium]|nr:trehalase family glycosidase [Actinomycetota bacterium]